ncbi:MAG: hypothetical protein H3C50_02845 [Kiritimatiellae bacterium]|nr:hypothetical protein [Kiritimatiellia bacterium]
MKKKLLLAIAALALIGVAPAVLAEEEPTTPYPLTTCIVSDEDLGSMGDAYVFKHGNQEIKLCCKRCLKKFNADPEKYLKKMADEAKAKAASDNP